MKKELQNIKDIKRPRLTGGAPSGPDRSDTEQGVSPKVRFTTSEKKEIIEKMFKIIIKTMFSIHICTFGGKVYKQLEGRPLGLRSTCSLTRLAMKVWDDKWLRSYSRSG